MQKCVGYTGTNVREIAEQIDKDIKVYDYTVISVNYQRIHGEFYNHSALVIYEKSN